MLVLFALLAAIPFVVFYALKGSAAEANRKIEAQESYQREIENHKAALMTSGNTAVFREVDDDNLGYRPVGKEAVLGIQKDVSRLELKSTGRYSSSGGSFSIPIVKGVRYRVSNRSVRAEKAWQVTAVGRLLVTDKAIVFESPEKNERITWGQVAGLELLSDGFQISKRTGPPRLFSTATPDAKFAATLELLSYRIED